jgi:hypothetical protein
MRSMRSKKELIMIFSNNEATVTVKCIHNTRARTLYLSKGINRLCNCHIAEGCVLYFHTYESDKDSLVEIPGSSPEERFFMLYTTDRTGGRSVSGFTAGHLYWYSVEQWRGKTTYRENSKGGNETYRSKGGMFAAVLYQYTAHNMYRKV